MGRNNNIISGRKGRPKGAGVKPCSRDIVSCIVDNCEVTKRGDKVKCHQRELVLWTSDGLPASSDHPKYSQLSDQRKNHTDYFRNNGYNLSKFPSNKRAAPPGPMDRFMLGPRQKKARLDHNSNIDSSHSDDTDPDDPTEEGDATTLNTTRTSGSGGAGGSVAYVSTAPSSCNVICGMLTM